MGSAPCTIQHQPLGNPTRARHHNRARAHGQRCMAEPATHTEWQRLKSVSVGQATRPNHRNGCWATSQPRNVSGAIVATCLPRHGTTHLGDTTTRQDAPAGARSERNYATRASTANNDTGQAAQRTTHATRTPRTCARVREPGAQAAHARRTWAATTKACRPGQPNAPRAQRALCITFGGHGQG